MGKALVLKGVNFEVNKLATVELSDAIPCMGISLSPDTISFSAIGATQQINATLTPADTTDDLMWTSSDANVATVSDSGLVTCIGIGTATITAVCGEQTETCAVTVSSITIDMDNYGMVSGYAYSGSLDYTKDPVRNHIGKTVVANAGLFYDPFNELNGYRAFVTSGASDRSTWGERYPIPIPKGTTSITVTVPAAVSSGSDRIRFVLANANEKQTYISGQDGDAAVGYKEFAQHSSGGTNPFVVSLSGYPLANAFIFSVKDNGSEDSSKISGVTVTFS